MSSRPSQRATNDYRSKGKSESQYAIYLRNKQALVAFAENFENDLELFEELESIDISDLYRWVQVWVTRKGSEDGDVSYGEMSEGERQLLTVLGLIRLSRNKRTIFLLDEPDTHLNPRWQYDYLDLIQRWAETSGDRCHLLLTTHNPLMIGSLRKQQVRVLSVMESGKVEAREPDDDPIGIGVEGLLKSELFGLRSTLAPEVLTKIDRHYRLLGNEDRTHEEDEEVRLLAIELNSLGISQTHPNPYFEEFAKAMARKAIPPESGLSKNDIEEQAELADEILNELQAEEAALKAARRVGVDAGDLPGKRKGFETDNGMLEGDAG
jgi:ABC-type multidrug transport system ATPase subunit